MRDKFINWLKWAVLVLLLSGVVWLLIEPVIFWTPYSEVRLYVRFFLVMFAVCTFAILRLYNSIVQNTRFSIRLLDAVNKLLKMTPALERQMKNLVASLGSVKNSSETLKRVMTEFTATFRLLERFRK